MCLLCRSLVILRLRKAARPLVLLFTRVLAAGRRQHTAAHLRPLLRLASDVTHAAPVALLSIAGQASVQIVDIVKVGVAVTAAKEQQGVGGSGRGYEAAVRAAPWHEAVGVELRPPRRRRVQVEAVGCIQPLDAIPAADHPQGAAHCGH